MESQIWIPEFPGILMNAALASSNLLGVFVVTASLARRWRFKALLTALSIFTSMVWHLSERDLIRHNMPGLLPPRLADRLELPSFVLDKVLGLCLVLAFLWQGEAQDEVWKLIRKGDSRWKQIVIITSGLTLLSNFVGPFHLLYVFLGIVHHTAWYITLWILTWPGVGEPEKIVRKLEQDFINKRAKELAGNVNVGNDTHSEFESSSAEELTTEKETEYAETVRRANGRGGGAYRRTGR
ncbi:hypothetical protein M427DRAFT_50674 [Gonapodya prolifera JEL478]|uniref:Uncharacterized protein n=1 Tax=Gonapodya prolifera (strain JEL478) TaxID=1344416 RepID=A0A139B036_GONPJ|nr:hypothetical protein M427DRAFT_50674 [Gonapodya prolifera JEL478]|eukprot:KXS22339.1 hypothetical protein M427DRAFT_50674 [Gonapodya prolifera JEL478]